MLSRMRRYVLTLFLFGISVFVYAGKQPKDTTLFTYGNKKVTTAEFYRGFTKNKHKDSVTKPKEVDEYLELYKKFKLKVQDAYDMGIDTTDEYKSELATYRSQIAKQFLMDTAVNEQLVQEAYQRLKYDVKASHILIFARPDAAPSDTLKAYQKMLRIKAMIDSGKITFENAALQYSEDPSAGENQGSLGYFTAFQMIYEFENQAYNTEVGKVSKVFRTEFGYHIVKVYEKRPSKGDISVKIIKIEMNPSPNAEEIEEGRSKINEVYKKLQQGQPFVTLVHQYSEDAKSVLDNGNIPPFTMTTVRWPENFKNTAFSLAKDGDYSEPIQTNSGFYIIQRIGLKPLEPIGKIRGTILTKIQKDSRQYRNTLAVYAKAKNYYGFSENKKYKDIVLKYVDSSLLEGMFDYDSAALKSPKLKNIVLFSLKKAKLQYTVNDFAKWLTEAQKPFNSKSLGSIVINYYDAYRVQTVMSYYEADLENVSPKFANLYREYKEGILLFNVMAKKVWNKSVEDSTGLKDYYAQHTDKYIFGDRYHITYFKCADINIANQLKQDLEKGILVDSILRKYNRMNPLNVSNPKTGKFEAGQDYYANQLFEKGTQGNKYMIIADPKVQGAYTLVQIHEFIPAVKKTLSEARGSVLSDYQSYLESKWVEELMLKYPIIVEEKVYASLRDKLTRSK